MSDYTVDHFYHPIRTEQRWFWETSVRKHLKASVNSDALPDRTILSRSHELSERLTVGYHVTFGRGKCMQPCWLKQKTYFGIPINHHVCQIFSLIYEELSQISLVYDKRWCFYFCIGHWMLNISFFSPLCLIKPLRRCLSRCNGRKKIKEMKGSGVLQ